MLNKHPSPKVEKEWLERVGQYGCVITRESYNIQRHHVIGKEGKKNKLYIGRWFVLPIAFELHDISSNHKLNVTHYRHRFTERHGKQSYLFKRMCDYIEKDGPLPFAEDIMKAILDTGW